MITPQEIRVKAQRLYPQAVAAWLANDPGFFPKHVPASLKIPQGISQAELIRQTSALRDQSKACLGYGYRVHYQQIAKRSHGDNLYPCRIEIESFDDLLRLIRKQSEFTQLAAAVGHIRRRVPQLEGWLHENWKQLPSLHPAVPDLLTVVEYLRAHPRPDCYVRELPLAVSTKLIENHHKLLRAWLDIVLPPESIDFGEQPPYFERRYGFRYARKHILLRLLDPRLATELGLPCCELSLPAEELERLPLEAVRFYVVENKINLLTLPAQHRAVALGGMGNNLSEFERIAQLQTSPVFYWGDIDVDGLAILAHFRHQFPHTQSLMMDQATLLEHRSLWTRNTRSLPVQAPPDLQPPERAAFDYCLEHGLRLEQEHIPQQYVRRAHAWTSGPGRQ